MAVQLIKGKQIATGVDGVVLSGTTGNVTVKGDLDMGAYKVLISSAPLPMK